MTTDAPSQPSRPRYTRPANIRIPEEMRTECQRLARANQLSLSDVLRLAIIRGLPQIRAGKLKLNT